MKARAGPRAGAESWARDFHGFERVVVQTRRMAREVTLVDAGLGNIASVERALIQVGGAVRVTRNPDEVAMARTVVFPGQGAFGAITKDLVDGQMGTALKMVIERGDPFLGICLGMQLLFDGSDENGGQEGLGIIPGRCRRFPDGMEMDAEQGAIEQVPEAASATADPEQAQTVAPAPAPAPAAPPALTPTPELAANPTPTIIPAAEPAPIDPQQVATPPAEPIVGPGGIERHPTIPLIQPPPPFAGQPTEPAAAAPEPPAPSPAPEPAAAPDPDKLVRRLKVPHMGWNSVEPTGDHYYFVHSYFVETPSNDDVMWMTTYGGIRFPAAVRRGNVLGCQFHPEKSQRAGLKFLRAFLLGGWG